MSASWASVTIKLPIADDLADIIEPIGAAAQIVGTILQVAGAVITVVAPILSLLAGGIPLPSTDAILALVLEFLEELISVEFAVIHHYPCSPRMLRSFQSWKGDIYGSLDKGRGNDCIPMDGFGALVLVVTSPADFEEMKGAISALHNLFGIGCIPDEDDEDLVRLPSLDFLRRFHCLPFGEAIPAVGQLLSTIRRGTDFVSSGPSDFDDLIALGRLLMEKGAALIRLADDIAELVDLLRVLAEGITVSTTIVPACVSADSFREQLEAATDAPDPTVYAGGSVFVAETAALGFLDLLF